MGTARYSDRRVIQLQHYPCAPQINHHPRSYPHLNDGRNVGVIHAASGHVTGEHHQAMTVPELLADLVPVSLTLPRMNLQHVEVLSQKQQNASKHINYSMQVRPSVNVSLLHQT